MILKDARQRYEDASTQASQVMRQLALGGIAFIWLLSGGLQGRIVEFSPRLLWAGVTLAASLCLDLSQYLYKTIRWARWFHVEEDRLQAGDDKKSVINEEAGTAPDKINYPTWTLWAAKMISLLAAYVLIFVELGFLIDVA